MTTDITDEDVGKSVVTSGGQEIGTVAEIDDTHIYIDFSGQSGTEHDQDIDIEEIEAVTDERVVIAEPETRA